MSRKQNMDESENAANNNSSPPTSTNTRSATKRYFNGNDFACKLEISFVRLYYVDEKWVTWPYKAVYLCAVWK